MAVYDWGVLGKGEDVAGICVGNFFRAKLEVLSDTFNSDDRDAAVVIGDVGCHCPQITRTADVLNFYGVAEECDLLLPGIVSGVKVERYNI